MESKKQKTNEQQKKVYLALYSLSFIYSDDLAEEIDEVVKDIYFEKLRFNVSCFIRNISEIDKVSDIKRKETVGFIKKFDKNTDQVSIFIYKQYRSAVKNMLNKGQLLLVPTYTKKSDGSLGQVTGFCLEINKH